MVSPPCPSTEASRGGVYVGGPRIYSLTDMPGSGGKGSVGKIGEELGGGKEGGESIKTRQLGEHRPERKGKSEHRLEGERLGRLKGWLVLR